MYYDDNSLMSIVNALDAQTISTDTTTVGEIIDVNMYESLTFAVKTATLTDGAYAVALYGSDTSTMTGDETSITGDDILGDLPSIALTDDDSVFQFGTRAKYRYFRLKIVSTATASGGALSATAVKGRARRGS